MPHSITRLALPMLGLCAAAFAVPALAQTTLDKIRLYAVSESHQLIAVSAAEPQKITRSVTLYGLAPNERILVGAANFYEPRCYSCWAAGQAEKKRQVTQKKLFEWAPVENPAKERAAGT